AWMVTLVKKVAPWQSYRPRPVKENSPQAAGTTGGVDPGSAERDDLVDEVRVREEHPTAAVSPDPQCVEDRPRVLARPRAREERLPQGADDLAAGEASDGDDHRLTGTTSGASFGPRGRAGSSGASAGCRGRSGSGASPGSGTRGPRRSGTGRGRGRSRCGPPRPAPSRPRRRLGRRCPRPPPSFPRP